MKMIHVKPAPGFRILNPDGNVELPASGKDVPDMPYWRHRAREGGVIITERKAPAAPAASPAPVKS